MTRSSKLALVTVLVGLLSLASVASVSADNLCAAGAYSDCVPITMVVDEGIVYHIEAASPMHILSGNGMGQEHFEAMDAGQFTVFSVAPDATTSAYPYGEAFTPSPGYPR